MQEPQYAIVFVIEKGVGLSCSRPVVATAAVCRPLPGKRGEMRTSRAAGMKNSGPEARNARWWALGDLNPRPLPCEGSALPLS